MKCYFTHLGTTSLENAFRTKDDAFLAVYFPGELQCVGQATAATLIVEIAWVLSWCNPLSPAVFSFLIYFEIARDVCHLLLCWRSRLIRLGSLGAAARLQTSVRWRGLPDIVRTSFGWLGVSISGLSAYTCIWISSLIRSSL